jgi:hypothetical protein
MKLDRISAHDYELFIQKFAVKKWGKPLADSSLELIFNLTELHSSYINRICGHFWIIDEFPTPAKIEKYWTNYIDSKRGEFTEDILRLSKNQRKVMQYLAKSPTAHPSHQDVCRATGISEASIRQAISKLTVNDHIFRDKDKLIRVLDPALKMFINTL